MPNDPQDDMTPVWRDLAALINSLPLEERQRYQAAIRRLVHDLRQDSGIIYSAEALVRREVTGQPSLTELLDIIRAANQRAMRLLAAFARPFDPEVTLPVRTHPGGFKRE